MADSDSSQRRLRVTMVGGLYAAQNFAVIDALLAEQPQATTLLSCEGAGWDSGAHAAVAREPTQVEFAGNRASSAELLEALARKLRGLSRTGSVQRVVVALHSADLLGPVAAALGAQGAGSMAWLEFAELEAVVVAIDGQRFFDDYSSTDTLVQRGLGVTGAERRHVAQVLAEQIETADVLVVTHADRASSGELTFLEDTLQHMNPSARLWRHPRAESRPPAWSDANHWGMPPREPQASGISSFVYRARRPFHPERLREQLLREWPGVLRSRGVLWLATRMSEVAAWSQAGPVWQIARAGHWLATLPRATWSRSKQVSAALQLHWQEPFGDRRQELHFVGWEMDVTELQLGFERCLLTDAELAQGPAAWALLRDPFAGGADVVLGHSSGGTSAAMN